MRNENLIESRREPGRDFISGDGRMTADVPRSSQIM
jgi:hypothetical protein